ncbi:hypothetical protein V9K97_27120 [Variovorax sp. CCNWLW186]|uniref:hypothetical protein n=1 Tax=Variovorax sp. CCNWLW186 TaxID=3127473 RepID=UPI00307769EE
MRLVLLLLAMYASGAHAVIPQVNEYRYTYGSQWTAWGDSAGSACPQAATFITITPPNESRGYEVRPVAQCWVFFQNQYGKTWSQTGREGRLGCPANSTSVAGGCQCASGYQEDSTHTMCVAQVSELEQFCQQHAAAKNTFKMSGSAPKASGVPGTSCYVPDPPFGGTDAGKGCSASLGDRIGAPSDDGTKINWAGSGSFDGGTCTADQGSPTPPSKDDPCPGGFEGTVNGETRCVPAEPDKGIEGVKQTSSTDASGTKQDVKETTKCEGANCTTTTTTTTTTAGGAVSTSTTSRTESLSDKCAKDPTNAVCQKTQGGKGAGVSQSTCQENPSAQGCGGEGAGIGDLYAKKDKTIAQVMKKASDDLKAAPLGSAVGGFFTVGSGGSCPSPSGVVPFLNKAVTFDMFCTNFAAQMFLIVRMVLLMLATWMAFRVAIDH